jgi:predicted permease
VSILARLRSWLGSVTRRSRLESEMDAEMRFHILSYAEDLMRTGVPREEAMRRARIEFGGLDVQKEDCRASLGLRLWDEIGADLKFGFRMLRHNRGFSAVAIFSLALGIGANTTIFTLAREVLLTGLGVPRPEELRLLSWTQGPKAKVGPAWGSFGKDKSGRRTGTPFTFAIYQEMREHNEVFEDLVAFKDINRLTANVGGDPEPVDAELVSENFYSGLGIRPIAGRPIAPSDTTVAVISDAYWARRFGRSAAALGTHINVNRVTVTIVGVNPPDFRGAKFGSAPEIFLPVKLQPKVVPNPRGSLLADNTYWWVTVLGRLKPGVGEKAAETSMAYTFRQAIQTTIAGKPEDEFPGIAIGPGRRGLDQLSVNFATPTFVLLIAAGLVLSIACVNLANLLLARSAARQREMSVRMALGAGKLRIIRQVLTESLLLAFLGGCAGLTLGYVCRDIIPWLTETPWRTGSIETGFDWRVFAFAFAITVATGILFGVAPAWRCMNAGPNESARMTAGRSHALLGRSLIVLQVGLSLVLLVGAGLFLRTLENLQTSATGFHPEHILLFDVNLPRSHYSQPASRIATYGRIEESVNALAGVQSATLSSEALLANDAENECYRPTGRTPGTADEDHPWVNQVGSRFFETFGIPILSGRGFDSRDHARSLKVGVINRRLAESLFPHANPIGKTLTACSPNAKPETIEIAGVSGDAKYYNLREEPPPTLYLPYAQRDDADGMTFEVKTAASPESVTAEVRQALRAIDRELPLLDVRTQTQQIDATLGLERVFATLTGGFGLIALTLAAVGIYGILAYSVAQRTSEIGIRMALGARTEAVLSMVLREAFWLASAGIALGLAGALTITRFLSSLLYGLKPSDPLTLGAAAFLLLAIALLAGFKPAFRASRVDPMQALRHE